MPVTGVLLSHRQSQRHRKPLKQGMLQLRLRTGRGRSSWQTRFVCLYNAMLFHSRSETVRQCGQRERQRREEAKEGEERGEKGREREI